VKHGRRVADDLLDRVLDEFGSAMQQFELVTPLLMAVRVVSFPANTSTWNMFLKS
jgi:hypothetical protein